MAGAKTVMHHVAEEKRHVPKPIATTLKAIRDCHPCTQGWRNLLRGLGEPLLDYEDPLPIQTILRINGIDDALWCLRTLPQYDRWWQLLAVSLIKMAHDGQMGEYENQILHALAAVEAEVYGRGKAYDREEIEHALYKTRMGVTINDEGYFALSNTHTLYLVMRNGALPSRAIFNVWNAIRSVCVRPSGHVDYHKWQQLQSDAADLLRGMLCEIAVAGALTPGEVKGTYTAAQTRPCDDERDNTPLGNAMIGHETYLLTLCLGHMLERRAHDDNPIETARVAGRMARAAMEEMRALDEVPAQSAKADTK